MDINEIRAPVQKALQAVEETIHERIDTEVELISQVAHYIMGNGGKRLRPMVLLLVAGACNYQGRQQIELATVVEFIHTATLLHDDVVDTSGLRRGKPTAHVHWTNATSILVGDFLYSKSFQLMVQSESLRILQVFSEGTNKIAEGEVKQLMNRHNADLSHSEYLAVLQSKTGKLFEIASHVGAILGQVSAKDEIALQCYGMHLGTAFQLIDDALDYSGSPAEIGKNIGDDLAEGSATLPLLYTLQECNSYQQNIIKNAIHEGSLECIEVIHQAIADTHAIQYTLDVARQEVQYAILSLGCLPDSPYKHSLEQLAHFAVERSH